MSISTTTSRHSPPRTTASSTVKRLGATSLDGTPVDTPGSMPGVGTSCIRGVYRIGGARPDLAGRPARCMLGRRAQGLASHRAAAVTLGAARRGRRGVEITCPRWRRTQNGRRPRRPREPVAHCRDVTRAERDPVHDDRTTHLRPRRVAVPATVDLPSTPRCVASSPRSHDSRGRRRPGRPAGATGSARYRSAVAERDPAGRCPRASLSGYSPRPSSAGAPATPHSTSCERPRCVSSPAWISPTRDDGIVIEYESAVHHTGKVALNGTAPAATRSSAADCVSAHRDRRGPAGQRRAARRVIRQTIARNEPASIQAASWARMTPVRAKRETVTRRRRSLRRGRARPSPRRRSRTPRRSRRSCASRRARRR